VKLSRKQIDILETLMKGDDDGDFLDMDRLLEKVSYSTSKQSMQFSVRALMKSGLLRRSYELRRGRKRVVWSLTMLGQSMFDTNTGQFDIIEEGLELDFQDMLD
jgi:predicted transcriptional regulator